MTTTRPQAVPTKLIDNERVVTTRWDFAPAPRRAGTVMATTTWCCRSRTGR